MFKYFKIQSLKSAGKILSFLLYILSLFSFIFLQSACQPQICKYGVPPSGYLDSIKNNNTSNTNNQDTINKPNSNFNNPTNPQPTKYGVPQKFN